MPPSLETPDPSLKKVTCVKKKKFTYHLTSGTGCPVIKHSNLAFSPS